MKTPANAPTAAMTPEPMSEATSGLPIVPSVDSCSQPLSQRQRPTLGQSMAKDP